MHTRRQEVGDNFTDCPTWPQTGRRHVFERFKHCLAVTLAEPNILSTKKTLIRLSRLDANVPIASFAPRPQTLVYGDLGTAAGAGPLANHFGSIPGSSPLLHIDANIRRRPKFAEGLAKMDGPLPRMRNSLARDFPVELGEGIAERSLVPTLASYLPDTFCF
jgi:hypothetical protein